MVKFTVITCTYNAEAEVERTLESVRRQSYPHVGHLIIDGVSKDKTMQMVHRYAETETENHAISVVCEPDKGLYDAMNKGIRLAKGDYIIFLNAGDKFASDETLAQVAAQIDTPSTNSFPLGGGGVGALYGDTNIVDNDGRFLRKRHLTPPEKLTWRSFMLGMRVCHQSFYVRTDIVQRNLYDLQYRFSADVDWCIRVMKDAQQQGLSLHNTHLVLTDYLDGGMSIKNHRASLKERFRIMAHHYGYIPTVIMHLWFAIRNTIKKQ